MRLAFSLSLLARDDEALETGYRGVQANPCDAVSRATYGEIVSRGGLHEAGVAELPRLDEHSCWPAGQSRRWRNCGSPQHSHRITDHATARPWLPVLRPD